MIHVGIIGTGYIGKVHLDTLSRLKGVKVTAAADASRELAMRAAAPYGVEKITSDYRKLIHDADIDVIHNCTPNIFHYDVIKEALLAGKQVLTEKPLSMNLQEAEELVNLAQRKKAVTGVNFCYRYYPLVQEMASRIRSNGIGTVRLVTGTWFQDWLSRDTDYSWRLDPTKSGKSNITADLGSHWFDLIQFTTGMEITEVFGDFQTIIPVRKRPKQQTLAFEKTTDQNYDTVKIELEEYSAVLFHLSNGAPGSFTTSQVCNGRKSDTEFQIYGSEDSLAWNHKQSNQLWIGKRYKPNEILIESPQLQSVDTQKYALLPAGHPMGYNDAVLNLFSEYYEAVSNQTADEQIFRPTLYTGYGEMKILDAIIRSAEKKSWITI